MSNGKSGLTRRGRGVNRLSATGRGAAVSALVEGSSIRATCRMTGTAKQTVLDLIASLGTACADYQDAVLRDLPCQRIQVDEIWSFCYAKAKNVPQGKEGQGYGDVWTYVALCQDTKLVPSWLVTSLRDRVSAALLLKDLRGRMRGRVQLTTDGHGMYLDAVEAAFGEHVDYAQLIKEYGTDPNPDTRYSPATVLSVERRRVLGSPDMATISTSNVERQNLTMRMGMRRFTRLTNGFSKKLANHEAQVALHFMHYNFARPHSTLKGRTPAQAAGVSRYRWSVEEIVGLLDAAS